MEENLDELQARVARLAGRINRHKSTGSSLGSHTTSKGRPLFSLSSYMAQLRSKPPFQDQGYRIQKYSTRPSSPYGMNRGRGWATPRYTPHRNRTLVLNGSQQQQDQNTPQTGNSASTASTLGWVTKRDRHMQLINNTVFDQKTQERSQAMAETRKQKQKAKEQRELSKINNHLVAVARAQSNTNPSSKQMEAPPHYLFVNDIKFLVADGGSKLIKADDEINKPKVPPKRAVVGGVTFIRSKHGNLYRAGLVKAKRSDKSGKFLCFEVYQTNCIVRRVNGVKNIAEPCPLFSTTGTCPKGPSCRYIHDPEKVAICRDFLITGKCQADTDCDLSHDPSPERVPACLHFQRGNCTNSECRYAHVRTNPGAPVCKAFAILGFCSKGLTCVERHVHECPDYANKGFCRNKTCRLPHVDRAGQLRRKHALTQEGETEEGKDEDHSSDVSSDNDLDGVDSDDLNSSDLDEDDLPRIEQVEDHELARQSDFVSFK